MIKIIKNMKKKCANAHFFYALTKIHLHSKKNVCTFAMRHLITDKESL